MLRGGSPLEGTTVRFVVSHVFHQVRRRRTGLSRRKLRDGSLYHVHAKPRCLQSAASGASSMQIRLDSLSSFFFFIYHTMRPSPLHHGGIAPVEMESSTPEHLVCQRRRILIAASVSLWRRQISRWRSHVEENRQRGCNPVMYGVLPPLLDDEERTRVSFRACECEIGRAHV